MMFTLRFSRQAHKFLEKQPLDVRHRIRMALLELAKNPLANRQVKRLAGTDELLRLRIGDFRVVFSIEQEELLILIIAIGNRGDIYRRL
ncbi:MAG: plasmid stabilization protein [Sulfobacillus acidophilus]|uniref:Plasmid stabilization protein n=1 Tax=Sulfobacillus acidophilus TaxID=53633 RepID=A0A2T2WIU4_9FIRM|nr:MAG: plasmid stabilization protein [Sulfobacillus acidophilus]